ncbi:MAG: hypothetical protein AUI36_11630 [Cyanobacteria bacterium 13_1_40CM_2_61_4]|nr:MAG: hypothetical protein AUI36_11630 [Cyanobacteria bacterium 13_1_40CM_2_61_4]
MDQQHGGNGQLLRDSDRRPQKVVDDKDVGGLRRELRGERVTELAPEEDPLHDRPLVLEAAAEREVPLELGREGAVDAAGGRDLRGVAGGSEDARAMAVLGEQPPEPDRDLRAAAGLPGDDQGVCDSGSSQSPPS